MINPKRLTSWFAAAPPMRDIVPINRFVSASVFQVKTGGFGSLLRIHGIDDESLTPEFLDQVSRRLTGAFRKLDESVSVYQYLIKTRGCVITRKPTYTSPIIESLVSDRVKMLEHKSDMGRVQLYLCLLVKSSGPGKATDRRLLEDSVVSFQTQVGELFSIELLEKQETFKFFRGLLNCEQHVAESAKLRRDDMVDFQLVSSHLTWKKDHLRLGNRFVQMFSLKEIPSSSAPNLWGELLRLDVDLVVCSEWQKVSTAEVRKQHGKVSGFLSGVKGLTFGKALGATVAGGTEGKAILKSDPASMELKTRLDNALILVEADGGYFGKFSLIGMMHADTLDEAKGYLPRLHRIFSDQEASMIEEGQGGLCAYYAMLPGNGKFNVRRQWLDGSAYADLSFFYAPNTGRLRSESLRDEYLAVYETRDGVPYYFDP